APQPDDAQAEAEVADTVDDERLLARLRRGRSRVPEPDQQVRAEADRLPEHVQEEEVAGEDQHRHREHEEVQIGEGAHVPGTVGGSDSPDATRENSTHDARNEPPSAGTATQCARRPMMPPRKMLRSAPTSGKAGISQTVVDTGSC